MVCRQTKITYFYVVVGIQKNVDRLQVPVDHSLKGESKETKFNLFPSSPASETLAFSTHVNCTNIYKCQLVFMRSSTVILTLQL